MGARLRSSPRIQSATVVLSAFRKDAGLSQIKLALLLGVGQSYISKIALADTYVDVFVCSDWVVAYGVKLSTPIKCLTESIHNDDFRKGT